MAFSDFVRLRKDGSFKSQTGTKHVIHYSIQAIDTQGRKLTVGEGFRGESQAKAAMRLISREFGLREAPKRQEPRDQDELLGPEVLT